MPPTLIIVWWRKTINIAVNAAQIASSPSFYVEFSVNAHQYFYSNRPFSIKTLLLSLFLKCYPSIPKVKELPTFLCCIFCHIISSTHEMKWNNWSEPLLFLPLATKETFSMFLCFHNSVLSLTPTKTFFLVLLVCCISCSSFFKWPMLIVNYYNSVFSLKFESEIFNSFNILLKPVELSNPKFLLP